MQFLPTTPGKYCINFVRRFLSSKILEHTRHRKKPVGDYRILSNSHQTFDFNAWDNVEWDEEQEKLALEAIAHNSTEKMTNEDGTKFRIHADKYWDTFYGAHQNKFFKDRHWLFTEFPEIKHFADSPDPRTIFELGCGVGNTIMPILQYCKDSQLKVYGCDFSSNAIEILKKNLDSNANRCHVFVMDLTQHSWNVPFGENSQDIIILIFVLSAIEPDKMENVVDNCYRYLRPGGLVLFRDYGRFDLAQLRFKSGKCLQDNCYARGDGTLVYFFTQHGVRKMFEKSGFSEEQNFVDRRLQVNRGRMLKMYRIWIQAKYRKPDTELIPQ